MRFAFDDQQREFAGAVRELLDGACDPASVRECWTNATGHSAHRWQLLADMGVTGLTVPEGHGGLGMGELDWVLVMEETGRAALPEPIVETVAVAAPMLAEFAPTELAAEWLSRIADGSAIVAVQHQGKPFVVSGGYADLLLLASGNEMHAVPRADVRIVSEQVSVDGARRIVEVDWHKRPATLIAGGEAGYRCINASFDRGALGTAAQLLGLTDRMLSTTVAYVKEREQFGVPIGSFQAVKHHLADALMALEFARPVVYRAAYSLAHGAPHRSRDVSMAKAYASDAATHVAAVALQCHGAIAYTVEYDLHLFMKRAWALAASWGDASWHRQRVAMSVLGPPPSGGTSSRASTPAPSEAAPLGETLA